MIEFLWRPYESIVGTVYRPIATVTLRGPKESLSSRMLIDSGADISLIKFTM